VGTVGGEGGAMQAKGFGPLNSMRSDLRRHLRLFLQSILSGLWQTNEENDAADGF
jgi:hypothetical protein